MYGMPSLSACLPECPIRAPVPFRRQSISLRSPQCHQSVSLTSPAHGYEWYQMPTLAPFLPVALLPGYAGSDSHFRDFPARTSA